MKQPKVSINDKNIDIKCNSFDINQTNNSGSNINLPHLPKKESKLVINILNTSHELENEKKNDNSKPIKIKERRYSVIVNQPHTENINNDQISKPFTNKNKKASEIKINLFNESLKNIPTMNNLNININVQKLNIIPKHVQIAQKSEDITKSENYSELSSQDITRPKKLNTISSDKFPSKKWRKISNLFRSLTTLQIYETKNLGDESELDSQMRDYKDRLFENTVRFRNSLNSECEKNLDKRSLCLLDSKVLNMLEKSFNFKEEIYKIIIDGDEKSVSKIQKILKKDPDYYLIDPSDPNYKYNTPMKNGKTLLYIACQEGKCDIVNFFIDKNFNAKIKSKFDDNEESVLQVATRWNYIKIVEVLLEKVQYTQKEIEEALSLIGITKQIKIILKNYLRTNFRKNNCCFR